LLAFTLAAATLRAQVGNDNPTGPAGQFNGNITTGCSYDPLTGNATRSIIDLAIAGGVGDYPLVFTRVANSRLPQAGDFGFGDAGGWRHSYAWDIDGSEESTSDPNFQPTVYPVNFPDGRQIFFTASSSDTYFRGPPGVSERFQPIDFGSMKAYLLLTDGGKIEFKVTRVSVCDYELHPPCSFSYSYQAQAIIDPHGLRTTLSYNTDGSLYSVQEPAGRWIQFFYTQTPWYNSNGAPDLVIDHIQASDGRVVTYHYAQASFSPGTNNYTYLDNVVYPFEAALNSSPTAFYTYQAPNGPNPNGYPLLASADDPMYGGPMKKISYSYATSNGDPLVQVSAGQILSENSGTTGQVVSQLYIPYLTWRNEIRGDGPSRVFEYGGMNGGPYLQRYTDFKGQYSSLSYDGNGYVSGFTDARGNTTTILREGTLGAPSRLTHPDQSYVGFAYWYANGGPYFLQVRGDERVHNSYFNRDGNFRLTRIDYPDYPNGAYETFSYNGFGQVYSHRMTSGGTETSYYDGRGLMYASSNPDGTTYYYYDGYDRLAQVTDARGYSTWFQYNARGQVTRVTHYDGSYAQSAYNADGTLASATDELGHTASYGYDDYKRVTSATNPLNETTSFNYAQDWVNSYVQTTANPKAVNSPMGKPTNFAYDENWQRTILREAAGTADDAWTSYGYDTVGNLASVQDPRGNVTTFGYDNRNRRTSMTNALNQTTAWQYDVTNNPTRETRPDQSFRRTDFDSMNRATDSYGFANEHTHYDRDLAGNVTQLIDAKGASYGFGYDTLNRKTSATYPTDATGVNRTEDFWYDATGNLIQYKNPANQYKYLGYDTRNRLISSSWSGGTGPSVGLGYDAASRPTIVQTNGGETTVTFGYDDANRKTWEEQTVTGFPTRRVETLRDADGFRSSLNVPNWFMVSYGYTNRGQLATISGSGSAPSFAYSYDLSGNMTKRQDVYGGVNDSTNIVDSYGTSQYDALNRPTMWEQTGTVNGVSNTAFARSHFAYDSLSRLTGSWRDEQTSKGEWYGYDATGQLTGASYNADQAWSSTPVNASRTVSYTMTPDTLNRSSINDSPPQAGEQSGMSSYFPNALNQYTNVAGGDVYYDGNFNLMWTGGFSAGYDAENHLTGISSGEDYGQFTYDGLGRCLKRTVDWETTLIAYDGWKPILQWDEFGNFKAWNVYGAGPDEILYRHDATRGDLRYHLDRMGNVGFLLDGDGDGIEKYTYDAFGQPTVTDWDGSNPRTSSYYGNRFMFTGREYFPELGLYDYRNRFYQPVLGRFLQSDPLGFGAGDANLFRYCGGDPVNWIDPSGLVDGDTTYKPLEPMLPSGWYATDPSGRIYKPDGSNFGPDQSGTTDRVIAEIPAGNVGPWGEHDPGPGDFSPNDHGSAGRDANSSGRGGNGSPNNGGSAASPGSRPEGSAPGWFVMPTGANPLDESLGSLYDFGPNNPFRQLVRYNRGHRADIASRLQFASAMNWYALKVSQVMALPAYGVAARGTAMYLAFNRQEIPDFTMELFGIPGPTAMPTSGGGWLGLGWRKSTWIFDEDGD
jgi:RHS repeat-associated protein